MSLTQAVVGMVKDMGQATADDLYAELKEEGYTRHQVIKALQNAGAHGYLEGAGHVPRRGIGAGMGSACTTYRVNPEWRAPVRTVARRAKLTPQEVSSVRASDEPTRVLAVRFGVTVSQINRIRAGQAWQSHAVQPKVWAPRVSSVWQLGAMA